ncbi:ribosome silencing factor [Paenimyroides tangerinum]|uniref:Ribosomal silencing factor RsfS n=1 Tax=Paenimyroides tangerinum TaxID=2488728 RepID=A0A3P3W9I5_9FLAO|nr:ribosome silencing factor [Paenimyroides tangerinum]RRJ90279.1 ribosome silencing factor [Paenimyroides tangerinum]
MTRKNNYDELLALIIDGIENVKGENITIMDLRHIDSRSADYYIICDGNSNTQVNAIAGSIQRTVSKQTSDKPWHVEGTELSNWVLMDYVNVVVHIFQKETREFYNLEDLWGDAEITTIKTDQTIN